MRFFLLLFLCVYAQANELPAAEPPATQADEGASTRPAEALPEPVAEIRLWDGPAPDAPATNPGHEQFDAEGRVSNVSVPSLSLYPPAKGTANGSAIIVCSGGAYARLAVKKHGGAAASVFAPRGIVVFSLKYRLRPPSKNVRADALADGERAVRLLRSRAGEWNLDPHRIGIIGYSAGANLILNLMNHFDEGKPDSPDPVERQSSRPDFVGLFATWPNGQQISDFHFNAQMPPAFLASAEDDKTAATSFTLAIEAELRKAGVPVHALIVPKGGHTAFTIRSTPPGDWPNLFLPWLEERGFYSSSAR